MEPFSKQSVFLDKSEAPGGGGGVTSNKKCRGSECQGYQILSKIIPQGALIHKKIMLLGALIYKYLYCWVHYFYTQGCIQKLLKLLACQCWP